MDFVGFTWLCNFGAPEMLRGLLFRVTHRCARAQMSLEDIAAAAHWQSFLLCHSVQGQLTLPQLVLLCSGAASI